MTSPFWKGGDDNILSSRGIFHATLPVGA
jgi:hypothetical protein